MNNTSVIKDLALVGAGYWGKNLARNFAELGALEVAGSVCRMAAGLFVRLDGPATY